MFFSTGCSVHFHCRLRNVKERADGDQFYKIYAQVLDASCYGIPQSRKRLFVVALRKKRIRNKFQWPTPMKKQVPFQSVLLPTKGGGRILGPIDLQMWITHWFFFWCGKGNKYKITISRCGFHFSPRTIEPAFQTDVATWFETGSKSRW